MSRIIVVGLGHGGLIAAAKLAKQGNTVTIYERRAKEEVGHEWEDRFDFDLVATAIEKSATDFPEGSWRYRGDSTFVSPDKTTRIDVHFPSDKRQKIMWRKPLIWMLIDYAQKQGVEIIFEVGVDRPIIEDDAVVGVMVEGNPVKADLVIDAAGVFSAIRQALPSAWEIEKAPARGDVFYAYRAYYNRIDGYDTPAEPFEVYLVHEGEPGLSWFCTNEDTVDILIGRIDPIDKAKVEEQLAIFKQTHPWQGDKVINGGHFAVIPVRRPMSVMIAKGYAAVGDCAFMTLPMNGMGIDLSIRAGLTLADSIAQCGVGVDALWSYNRNYLIRFGAKVARNEGLKNALLNLPPEGVDALYKCGVIEAQDLAGGGENMSFGRLIRKLVNGMRCPKYFFAIVKGLMKGAKVSKALANPPTSYDIRNLAKWKASVEKNLLRVK